MEKQRTRVGIDMVGMPRIQSGEVVLHFFMSNGSLLIEWKIVVDDQLHVLFNL